jgi:hypothetical protein
MITVELSDGRKVEFPDDMPREKIKSLLQGKGLIPGGQQTPPPSQSSPGFFSELGTPNPTTNYGQFYPIARDEGSETRRFAPSMIMQEAYKGYTAPRRSWTGELQPQNMNTEAFNMASMLGAGTAARIAQPTIKAGARAVGKAGAEVLASPAVTQVVGAARSASGAVAGFTGIPQTIRRFIDRLPASVDRVAAERIAERMYQDGLTVDDIGRTLQGLGKEGTLADAGGRNILNQTRRLIQEPGTTAQLADEVLDPRNAATASRIVKSTQQNISGKDFYNEIDRLTAQQAKGASPKYRKAYSDHQNLSTPWLRNAMEQEPVIMQGIKEGIASLRQEATILGNKYTPRESGVVDFNVAGDPIIGKETPLSMWHAARRGIDDILEASRDTVTGKLPSSSSQLIRLRKRLDDELKSATGGPNGAFSQADAIYAGPAKIKDAMRRGRKFAVGDGELTEKLFKGMSAGEQEAYRIGAAREMIKNIRKNGTTPPILRNILKDTEVADKIKLFAPTPRQYQKFIQTLDKEARFSNTNSLRAGSPTGLLKAEGDDMGAGLSGMVLAGAVGNPTGAAISGISTALKWLRNSGISQPVRDRMGKMLLSQDHREQRKVLDMIREMQTPAIQTPGQPFISGGRNQLP